VVVVVVCDELKESINVNWSNDFMFTITTVSFIGKNVKSLCYSMIGDYIMAVVYPGIFFGGGRGGQQIQLRAEGRQNRDLVVVAP
jgi:hypothetical protein